MNYFFLLFLLIFSCSMQIINSMERDEARPNAVPSLFGLTRQYIFKDHMLEKFLNDEHYRAAMITKLPPDILDDLIEPRLQEFLVKKYIQDPYQTTVTTISTNIQKDLIEERLKEYIFKSENLEKFLKDKKYRENVLAVIPPNIQKEWIEKLLNNNPRFEQSFPVYVLHDNCVIKNISDLSSFTWNDTYLNTTHEEKNIVFKWNSRAKIKHVLSSFNKKHFGTNTLGTRPQLNIELEWTVFNFLERLVVYNTEGLKKCYLLHKKNILFLRGSSDGKSIITASEDKTIRVTNFDYLKSITHTNIPFEQMVLYFAIYKKVNKQTIGRYLKYTNQQHLNFFLPKTL